MDEQTAPFHHCHVSTKTILFNRCFMSLNALLLSFLLFYRSSFFLSSPAGRPPAFAWAVVSFGELFLAFQWVLNQAFRWRPIRRTAFPDRLPEPHLLPSVDVFICTADPDMEPTIDVMNTIVSAMALDYPPGKLNVYLSDDGGSPRTLNGMREAYEFARAWLPFCRKYSVRTICPKAYFKDEGEGCDHPEYASERKKIEERYDLFEDNITKFKDRSRGGSGVDGRNHPFNLEIINGQSGGVQQRDMPLLVYVAREKRPSHHHNFKAGALNVLIRVSALISNSPYFLVLDCDMRCDDPSSVKQAMCFHMDKKINSSLAFVQFPQRFHNISKNDIYDSQIRSVFTISWFGMDGLRGPVISGTCFYMKRESLLRRGPGDPLINEIKELRKTFGLSNELVQRLRADGSIQYPAEDSSTILEDAKVLASCEYETDTKWGKQVGFLYHSVVEDVFTSFNLHCRGWTSVYLSPQRPQFLGTSTICLNDLLVQGTRWSCGLIELGLSGFCPLIYGPTRMSILQSMCYAELGFFPLALIPVICFAVIPPLCLFYGVPIYPMVWDPCFIVFPLAFSMLILKHLIEVLSSGHPAQTCINEMRISMIKSVTCHVYGTVNGILKLLGLRKSTFVPTNKVSDDEQLKRYEIRVFDFQTSPMFLVPVGSLVMLNIAAFVVGICRAILQGDWNRMFLHIMLSAFVLIMSYPVIEGMTVRKDKGRIAPSVTRLSALVCVAILVSGWFYFA
ncbi:hypothetical protein MLD38_018092 [Melastoma candidum]|uniref:Uncharacterized protein n=1 Tax=Melastoma candidum TaxID=119954 RepID=A0ACB9QRW0_9MYRT|nr:hypothetical protein MLD38_018092 [Melastoma candidum]